MLAFIIEAFANEKLKRAALEKELRWERGDFSQSYGGVQDWRSLIVRSSVDFSGYLLARNRHHADVYDAIYKEEVLKEFPALSAVVAARALYPSGVKL